MSRSRPAGKPILNGVNMSQHLSFVDIGKAVGRKPRSEPDWGNPTVRDRRGACGNVAGLGSRTEAHRETDGIATVPFARVRAALLSRPFHGMCISPKASFVLQRLRPSERSKCARSVE